MSRRAVPFLVAGVTGVLSGIYIFKPLFDRDSSPEASGDDAPTCKGSSAVTRSGAESTAPHGNTSPNAVSQHGVVAQMTSQNTTSR
ncbi:hypothetical protein BD414DRAFT_491961 [Trametes punicea]|nr:hypothetical protein BD414DRAFT_491961 [Trametes punicea]